MSRFPARQSEVDPAIKTGFTIIEIVIVIAIIGLLWAALLFASQAQVQKGRDSRRKMDMDLIRKSVEEYYDTGNCYPDSLPACNSPFTAGSTTLLRLMPCDPQTRKPYIYVTDGDSCHSEFEIFTKLEYTQDSAIDILGCRDHGCGPSCQYNYGVTSTNKPLDVCS